MMSSDYSFRINDRLYEINGEPISSTLGDFLNLTQLLFRANLRGQEQLEHYFLLQNMITTENLFIALFLHTLLIL